MLIKALKSFVGEVNMTIDEVKEVTNEKLAQALIDAGMAEKAKAKDLKEKIKNKKGKETEELNDVDENANKPLEEPPKDDDKEEKPTETDDEAVEGTDEVETTEETEENGEPSTEGEEEPVEETTDEVKEK